MQAFAEAMCYVPRMHPSPSLAEIEAFDERQFYLEEFRGKTLLVALHADDIEEPADEVALAGVVRALAGNDTRVMVVIGAREHAKSVIDRIERKLLPAMLGAGPRSTAGRAARQLFAELDANELAAGAGAATVARIWSTLRRGPVFVGVAPGCDLQATRRFACQIATRFRVHKLVLVDQDGGFSGSDGKTLSFLDEAALGALLGLGEAEWTGLAGRVELVTTVRDALLHGVASVNVCSLLGTARELFTYEGSGTLFTLQDYCSIDRLGIDDFEEAERLIERGQREGLLKPRSADEIAALLAHGYGATIATHHLAGFAAFVTEPYARDAAGEIVGLYTITRFKGEGVGDRLVDRIVADARSAGMGYVFATTTSARAQGFFERRGFQRVTPADVPPAKWSGYDEERMRRAAVLRLDLAAAGAS